MILKASFQKLQKFPETRNEAADIYDGSWPENK